MWKTHGFRRRIVHKWIQPYTTFLIFHIYGTVSPGQSMEPLTGAPYARSGRRCRRRRRVAVAVRLHGGSSDAMLQRHLSWAQALKHWATWPGWNWIGNWMELEIGNWLMMVNDGTGTTKWGPRSIAKLVHITPITMVYGTQITIVIEAYKTNL